jgi:hypothetical protein
MSFYSKKKNEPLFLLITVLIPLHGWRFGMNKLSTESNRWRSLLAAFHLQFRVHAMKSTIVIIPGKSYGNTCKEGSLPGTKNKLKETRRLAINCTSCTRLLRSGRFGSKNFLRSALSYGNFLLVPFASRFVHSERNSRQLMVHCCHLVVCPMVKMSMSGNFPF